MIRKTAMLTAAFLLTLSVTAQHIKVKSVEHERILIDSRYAADKEGEEVLKPYKVLVDSLMAPVVGHTAKAMASYMPESELANLIADIMVWSGKIYAETPEIGFFNTGGIRASLPQGAVTLGDINDMSPFNNKISYGTLTGRQLTTLFRQIATSYGFSVSKGVKAVYVKGQLTSLTFNGKEIDPEGKYRIATNDYLMHGNDGFRELANATFVVSPQDQHAVIRDIIAAYFRERETNGEKVDAEKEGRITMEK